MQPKQTENLTTDIKSRSGVEAREQMEALEVQQLLEALLRLDVRYRSKIALLLIATLGSKDIELIKKSLPKLLDEARATEEANNNIYAKFEYKHLSSGDYAYIREWGTTKCNIYMGRMYLKPKHKYRAKNKQGVIKVFVSLGLHRVGENKVHLKIHQLEPTNAILDYEFFDLRQQSKVAQEILRKKIELLYLRKGGWSLEDLGEQNIDIGYVTPTTQYTTNDKLDTYYEIKKIKDDLELNSINLASAVDRDTAKQLKEERTVEMQLSPEMVRRVTDILQTWVSFNRAVPKRLQVKIIDESRCKTLITNSEVRLIELSISTNTVLVTLPNLLVNTLEESLSIVANSSLIDQEQKLQASRWLHSLAIIPQQNIQSILEALLYLY